MPHPLAALLGSMSDDDDAPAKPRHHPDPVAQAMELRDRWARLNVRHEFRPGDLVRDKIRVGTHKPDARLVFVVLRHLDASDPYDVTLLNEHVDARPMADCGLKPDLVVGDIMQCGDQLACSLVCSLQMEPVTDADLASWCVAPGGEG